MANIVLAHGLLGFGAVFPKKPIQYFNRIYAHYEKKGHHVLCPQVPSVASISIRAGALKKQIMKEFTGDDPIYLLAHSMGGLDCRRMLATDREFAKRFPRLITIATPHYGSPVADAVLREPFREGPSGLQRILAYFGEDTGALNDLKTRTPLDSGKIPLQDHDVDGVEYLCIGCDAAGVRRKSPIFAIAEALGRFGPATNDGLVSLASASRTHNPDSLYKIWPVDHGGAIGWPSGRLELFKSLFRPPADHLERYDALLPILISAEPVVSRPTANSDRPALQLV